MHDMQVLRSVPERPIPPNVQPQRPDPRLQRVGPERRAARFSIEGIIRSDRPLRSVYSPTHPLDLVQDEEGIAEFTAEGVLHDRQGFSLYYAESEDRDVGMSLLTHRPPGEDGFFLLSISPGWQNGRARMAKNLIFVLDTSGSMQGDGKLEQAVEALVFGLGTLGPEDRFGIISYSSTVRSWRDDLSTADRRTVRDARAYADGLSAAGGTNIEGALALAADMARRAATDRNGSAPTYVIFLTDGLPTVGEQNPDALLSMSGDRIPERARLFTWGVGYDVNAFLLDRLAEEHGGRSAYVEPFEDLEVKVSGFFDQISVPVLADLGLNIRGAGAYDMFPEKLPDLFRGGRITVMGRFRGSGEIEMRLTGTQGDRERRIASRARLPRTEHDAGFLASMWAQRKVGYLLEQIRLHGESEELKKEIIALGEQYGLVTPYTAYLVIEDQMRITEEMEADAAAAPAEVAMRAIARDARRGRESSMYAGAAGNRQQTGDMAVQLSKAEKALQEAESFRQVNYLRVQRVEEKTFHLDENTGIWRDAALKPDQEVEQIEVGSDDFIKLLDKHEELSRWSAIGQTVEVLLDGRGYQIQIPKLDPK
jgi:Ca-activated chloride channel family protein